MGSIQQGYRPPSINLETQEETRAGRRRSSGRSKPSKASDSNDPRLRTSFKHSAEPAALTSAYATLRSGDTLDAKQVQDLKECYRGLIAAEVAKARPGTFRAHNWSSVHQLRLDFLKHNVANIENKLDKKQEIKMQDACVLRASLDLLEESLYTYMPTPATGNSNWKRYLGEFEHCSAVVEKLRTRQSALRKDAGADPLSGVQGSHILQQSFEKVRSEYASILGGQLPESPGRAGTFKSWNQLQGVLGKSSWLLGNAACRPIAFILANNQITDVVSTKNDVAILHVLQQALSKAEGDINRFCRTIEKIGKRAGPEERGFIDLMLGAAGFKNGRAHNMPDLRAAADLVTDGFLTTVRLRPRKPPNEKEFVRQFSTAVRLKGNLTLQDIRPLSGPNPAGTTKAYLMKTAWTLLAIPAAVWINLLTFKENSGIYKDFQILSNMWFAMTAAQIWLGKITSEKHLFDMFLSCFGLYLITSAFFTGPTFNKKDEHLQSNANYAIIASIVQVVFVQATHNLGDLYYKAKTPSANTLRSLRSFGSEIKVNDGDRVDDELHAGEQHFDDYIADNLKTIATDLDDINKLLANADSAGAAPGWIVDFAVEKLKKNGAELLEILHAVADNSPDVTALLELRESLLGDPKYQTKTHREFAAALRAAAEEADLRKIVDRPEIKKAASSLQTLLRSIADVFTKNRNGLAKTVAFLFESGIMGANVWGVWDDKLARPDVLSDAVNTLLVLGKILIDTATGINGFIRGVNAWAQLTNIGVVPNILDKVYNWTGDNNSTISATSSGSAGINTTENSAASANDGKEGTILLGVALVSLFIVVPPLLNRLVSLLKNDAPTVNRPNRLPLGDLSKKVDIAALQTHGEELPLGMFMQSNRTFEENLSDTLGTLSALKSKRGELRLPNEYVQALGSELAAGVSQGEVDHSSEDAVALLELLYPDLSVDLLKPAPRKSGAPGSTAAPDEGFSSATERLDVWPDAVPAAYRAMVGALIAEAASNGDISHENENAVSLLQALFRDTPLPLELLDRDPHLNVKDALAATAARLREMQETAGTAEGGLHAVGLDLPDAYKALVGSRLAGALEKGEIAYENEDTFFLLGLLNRERSFAALNSALTPSMPTYDPGSAAERLGKQEISVPPLGSDASMTPAHMTAAVSTILANLPSDASSRPVDVAIMRPFEADLFRTPDATAEVPSHSDELRRRALPFADGRNSPVVLVPVAVQRPDASPDQQGEWSLLMVDERHNHVQHFDFSTDGRNQDVARQIGENIARTRGWNDQLRFEQAPRGQAGPGHDEITSAAQQQGFRTGDYTVDGMAKIIQNLAAGNRADHEVGNLTDDRTEIVDKYIPGAKPKGPGSD